jgi:hypothetical protein
MSRVVKSGENAEAKWIRSYALAPRRLSDGHWVWLRPYEWRWHRAPSPLPRAVNPPRVFTRRVRPEAAEAR